jgi:type III restriction enzyme
MELKRYQERVVREFEAFLDALAKEQEAGARHAALDAWARTGGRLRAYGERTNGLGEDLPSVCLKVPTGGGKTLVATLVLGLVHETILRARNGAGLVLWVVPSEQIYRDTLRALRDRRHPYRESLEGAIGRRIEVWEKHEIARLSPTQLASALNVLVVQLGSTNRESNEQLKFFRDSGGNIVQHFPPEDDLDAHTRLKEQIANLDVIEGTPLVKTSLANLVRVCRPAVIVDEGHKAASGLALRTIEGMNPSIVVELSATPAEKANVLVSVSGQELLDEEMIKLPINVVNTAAKTWKECLARAVDQRKELAALAKKTPLASGRYVRPIVLVQVERTGKDQRDGKHVHAEDVKEELVERHGVASDQIAIKTSSQNDIEDMDLLDEGCRVEWIITKAALQEGWDCPYAYVLVSLNASESKRAMTQLVGRVLRQPEARRTGVAALDESYVFCLKRSAGEVVKEVKGALEKEGYEGDYVSQRDVGEERAKGERPVARFRREFARHYLKPFEGKIFLPRFCVEVERREFEELDYFRHLLARVDPFTLDVSRAGEWSLADELRRARGVSFRVSLGDAVERTGDEAPTFVESDAAVHDWLAANLGIDYLGLKESRSIVLGASKELLASQPQLRGSLGLVKHLLREKMAGLVQEEVDRATEAAFRGLFEAGKIKFYLHCVECRFEIPRTVTLRALQKKMVRDDNGPLQRSLFDYVPDELNSYEREVALVLDRDERVLWWYRNLVGAHNFAIQGYRRNRIYPDFVVQQGKKTKPNQHVVVIESKGSQLSGNPDTTYKRKVAEYFTKAGKLVKWQQLASGFADRVFRFQVVDQGDYAGEAWREEIQKLLQEDGTP